jgi:hypothetical protein
VAGMLDDVVGSATDVVSNVTDKIP